MLSEHKSTKPVAGDNPFGLKEEAKLWLPNYPL
jgi:hypothetical protein